jgi:hypothetical protein
MIPEPGCFDTRCDFTMSASPGHATRSDVIADAAHTGGWPTWSVRYTVLLMRKIKIGSVVLTFTLVAAACGSDGSGSPFGPPGEQGGSDAVTRGDIVEELFDGNLDGIDLGDLANGNFDESSLEDLMESAQDLAENFANPGSGTIRINGDTINFTSELCTAFQDSFSIEGAGTTGDGTPVWVSISSSKESRQDLVEFMGEDTVQLVYGDADPVISNNVAVNYGQTDMFGRGPDDMPSLSASLDQGVAGSEMVIEVTGDSARGSGSATDWNFVLGDFDATFDFTFEAACS